MSNLNNFFAKSENNILIVDHSKNVATIAVKIAEEAVLDKNDPLIEVVRISSLLHDIGKMTQHFQNILKKVNEEDKFKFRHNEIGWAFLYMYLNTPTTPIQYFDVIIDAVYWHHGISNKLCDNYAHEVLKEITDDDIENMKFFLKEILGPEFIREKPREYRKKTPLYYFDEDIEKNYKNLFVKMCVISSDRIVSSNDYLEQDVLKIIKKMEHNVILSNSPHYGNSRFILQEEIVSKTKKTTLIKATAGFGKTLIGLLWNFKSDKKLIWVCPRNEVAKSIYKSVIEELKNFKSNISVELYLSGEVKESNINSKGFEADIIITNIDNFLAPTIDNAILERLFFIINCDVIFDEYHELENENALFASFINIMNCRNKLTNSKTLLLSATPQNMHFLWESMTEKTTILPNENEHYPAIHNKEFLIKTYDDESCFMDIKNDESNLIIMNSIYNAQKYAAILDKNILVHSEYDEITKQKLLSEINEKYGKNSNRSLNKENVISTHILQASLDISFCHLYESVISPQATLQRNGRMERWGDYCCESVMNIIKFNDRSENLVKNILYDIKLTNLWYDTIQKYNGQKITKDKLYEIYNEHSKKYEKEFKEHINNNLDKSIRNLSKIYPIKYNKPKVKNKIIRADGNKLRTSGNEIFFISKKYNSEEWVLFNKQIFHSFEVDFKEESNTYNRIKKNMKFIKDEKFNFDEIIKNNKITPDGIRKLSKKSNTPYVSLIHVVEEKFGLILKEDLVELQKIKNKFC